VADVRQEIMENTYMPIYQKYDDHMIGSVDCSQDGGGMTAFSTSLPYNELRWKSGPWYEPVIRVICSGIQSGRSGTGR
jgi:hypothetical protein